MEPRIADLIFVRGTGPISRAIEEIEHSPYSHVAGVVKENELIEAPARICSYLWADAYRQNGIDRWPGIRFPSPADVPKPMRYVVRL